MMLPDDLRTPQPPYSAATTISPGPPTVHHNYSLPSNPMPYLAPSVTHQPELLLLHWMINTISSLIEDLQHHPIVQDPIPPMSTFTNTPAYRLFLQTRNTLRHLINTTHEARRGLNKLQFIPGSPGSPSTGSVAETGLVLETGFPSPHSHSQTTQPQDTRTSRTDLPQLPATADTCTKHSGRPPPPALPPRQLATYLLTHRLPPPEASGNV